MNKKRILICDDTPTQAQMLGGIATDAGYEVCFSQHWEHVLNDLIANAPVHLLILDLMFTPGTYDGHKCLPAVTKRFPNLPIITYSQLQLDKAASTEAAHIYDELLRIPIRAFLGPANKRDEVREAMDRELGTSRWLREDIWLLHVSDLQFGGDGLPESGSELAKSMAKAVERFVASDLDADEEGPRRPPFACIVTGDLSQHSRPGEYDMAQEFLKCVGETMTATRPDMVGVLGRKDNVIVVPGNHDVNWDILRAQNIQASGKKPKLECVAGKPGLRPELTYLREYAWMPYCRFDDAVQGWEPGWAWEPGYSVRDLSAELGIVAVYLNSSRWTVDHLEQRALVAKGVWLEIQKRLDEVDPNRASLRMLVTHHSLHPEAKLVDQLGLKESPEDRRQLVDLISGFCGVTLALTGHIHLVAASPIDTGGNKRSLTHAGAGTSRTNDVGEFGRPEFNLLRVCSRDPGTNKYGALTVYAFEWNGAQFGRCSAFEGGQKAMRSFGLAY